MKNTEPDCVAVKTFLPDEAVCTGDLTSAGQPGEFSRVLEIIKPLWESDIPLIYTPGNHDCYVKRPKCVAAVKNAVKVMSRGKYSFDGMPQKLIYNGVEISHYLMTDDHPWLRIRHRLFGQKKVLQLMDSKKLDLVLCGHVHKPYLKVDEQGRGECSAGSVSSCLFWGVGIMHHKPAFQAV